MSTTDYRTARREDRAADRAQDREDRRAAEAAQLERERLAAEQQLEQKRLEREAAAEQTRLAQEAEDRRRAQDRADREQRAAARQAQLERERQAKAAAAKERKREKAKAAKERRDRWRRRAAAVPGWISRELDLAAAVLVMAASIVPALIAQSAALKSTGLDTSVGQPVGSLMLILLPVMLEISAWAAVAGEAKAMKAGRSATSYRIAVWAFAGFAAAINFYFGAKADPVLGVVLAAASIVPVTIWQMVQLGRHAAERQAAAKQREAAAKAREEERAAKARVKATREAREKLYPEVWTTALQLRAIGGHERLSEEDAWQAAWAVHEGAGDSDLPEDLMVLLSADLLALRTDAEERLASVLTELRTVRTRRLQVSVAASMNPDEIAHNGPARVSMQGGITPPTHPAHRVLTRAAGRVRRSGSSQVGTSNPAPAPTRDTRTQQSPVDTPQEGTTAPETAPKTSAKTDRAPRVRKGRGPQSAAAKNAAATTAKTSAVTAAAEKHAIETWVADRIREGADITWQDIRDEALRRRREDDKRATEPSRSWCYARRTAAEQTAGVRRLHAA